MIPESRKAFAVACLAVVGLAVLLACGEGDDGGTEPPPVDGPALRILAGAGVTDTISTTPLQGLVARVLGEDGEPETGVGVRFEVPPDSQPFSVRLQVGAIADQALGRVAGATTDGEGRATVRVRLGELAGPAIVVITVPLYSLVDTAEYTVLPGNAVRVALSPGDTVLAEGATFSYRGSTLDRANNPRQDPAVYQVRGTAVTVDATGLVTAVAVGSAVVRLEVSVDGETVADSGTVTVLPDARVAWTTASRTLALGDLIGENVTTLVNSRALAPAWAPDGNRLVYVRIDGLSLVDLDGNVTGLATPGVSGATWPEFSADGQWIYFQGRDDEFRWEIFRIRPDGSGMEEVGPEQGDGEMPTPSPDGTSVAWVGPSGQLVIRDLAAGTERTLSGTLSAVAPHWSPDGAWIAYTTGGRGELMLVRPDGTDLHRIGQHGLFPGIYWSPDSKWIIGMESRTTLVDVATGVMSYLTWRGEYPAWQP